MLNMSAVQLQYMRQCGHVHRQVGMRACQQTSAEDVTKPSTSLRGCMQVCVCVCVCVCLCADFSQGFHLTSHKKSPCQMSNGLSNPPRHSYYSLRAFHHLLHLISRTNQGGKQSESGAPRRFYPDRPNTQHGIRNSSIRPGSSMRPGVKSENSSCKP